MAKGKGKLRIGIIGLGIGKLHARGVQAYERGVLEAFCDIDEKRLAEVAAEFGVSKTYTDYRDLCRDEDVDAVSVCVPNALHVPIAVYALRQGKHVLVEKPLSVNAASARRLVRAAEQSDRVVMMAFSTRFSTIPQALKPIIERGELGEIYFAKAMFLRRKGIPGYGSWFTQKELAGGGPLIDLGVHILETTWWLMGCPKPVSAVGATYAKFGPREEGLGTWGTHIKGGKFDVEDHASGYIKFANGASLFLEASWAQHVEPTERRVELYGTEGGASFDPLTIYKDLYGQPVSIPLPVKKVPGHANEIRQFIDCCLDGTENPAPLEHGLIVQQMLDAIYKSSETGREVKL